MNLQRRNIILVILMAVAMLSVVIVWQFVPDRDNVSRRCRSLLLKGQDCFNNDSIFTAMDCFAEAMQLAEAEGDSVSYFEAAVHVSMIYDLIGESDRSYALLKGLRYVEVTDSGAFASQYYYRLMALYAAKKDSDYAKSVAYNQRAIDLDRRVYHNESFVCQELANIGETYLMAHDYSRMAAIVRQLQGHQAMDNTLYLSGQYYLNAILLLKQGQTDSAYHEACRGERQAAGYGAYDNQMLNLKLLCQMDSLRNELPAYIRHRNQLEQIKATVQGGETRLKIASIQEKNRSMMASREQANARLVQWLVGTLGAVAIVALVVVILVLRKNYRTCQRMAEMERQSLDQAVERKRLENELLTLKVKTNELRLDKAYKENLSLSETLAERTVGMPEESLAFMESVMKDKEQAFMQRVEETYPQLTYNDIRLMSFIRMGMTAHAISSALGISSASLTTARYRLRKKLNLAKDTVLEDFVANI